MDQVVQLRVDKMYSACLLVVCRNYWWEMSIIQLLLMVE